MAGKFSLTRNGQSFHFSLAASNGEKLLSSETYSSKAAAQNGIESVKTSAAVDHRYERRTAKDGRPYFVLKASNGEVIGTSETYSGTGAMENGIASVKENAPTAVVDDRT